MFCIFGKKLDFQFLLSFFSIVDYLLTFLFVYRESHLQQDIL